MTAKDPTATISSRKLKRTFREACEARGYDPADLLVMWRVEAGKKAQEYLECANMDLQHGDMPTLDRRELRDLAFAEMAALAKWDLELLPYAYGRPHQTSEVTATVFNPTIAKEDADV